MSSGNVNIGFVDKRCSSRILKPPGGGYSDIFGVEELQTVSPKQKHYNVSQSVMQDILSNQAISITAVETTKSESEIEITTRKSVENTDIKVEEVNNSKGDSEEVVPIEIMKAVGKLTVSTEVVDKVVSDQKIEQNGTESPSSIQKEVDKEVTEEKTDQNGTETSASVQKRESIKDIISEDSNEESKSPTKVEDTKSEPNTPSRPAKHRIPPGGYSSGLW